MRSRSARAASSTPATAAHFLDAADVVLGVGTQLHAAPHHHPVDCPPGKKIIHATNDTRDLYKTYDVDVPILGDAKLVLGATARCGVGSARQEDAAAAHAAQEIARLREGWLAKPGRRS